MGAIRWKGVKRAAATVALLASLISCAHKPSSDRLSAPGPQTSGAMQERDVERKMQITIKRYRLGIISLKEAQEALVRLGEPVFPIVMKAVLMGGYEFSKQDIAVVAVPALIRSLKKGGISIHSASIISYHIDARALPVLNKAIKDRNADVRMMAAFMLGLTEDVRAVPALLGARKDERKVRWNATRSLFWVGNSINPPKLAKALKDSEAAFVALLKDCLMDRKHPDFARQAAFMIKIIIESEIEAKSYKSGLADRIVSMLNDMGTDAGEGITTMDISSRVIKKNPRAHFALRLLPYVFGILRNGQKDDRCSAAELLGHMGWVNRGTAAMIVPKLAEAQRDGDSLVRYYVIKALTNIRDKSAVPTLVKALRDSDHINRENAAFGLGVIGDRSALPELEKHSLKPEEPDVRKTVQWAIREIKHTHDDQ